jgi:hypothetical protein
MVRPTGVTVIAILCFVGAAFAALGGIGMIVGGGFVATLMKQQGEAGSAGLAGIMAGLGAALGIFFLILAALDVAIAIGLLNLKEWARIVTIVLTGIGAALGLLGLLGGFIHFVLFASLFKLCVLAIQGLIIWYLLKPEVKAAFQAPQVRAASA